MDVKVLVTGETYRDACEALGHMVPAFKLRHAKFLVHLPPSSFFNDRRG